MALRPNFARDYKQIPDFNEACRTFNRDIILYEQTEALKALANKPHSYNSSNNVNFYEPKLTRPIYDLDDEDDLTASEKLKRSEYKRLVDKYTSIQNDFEFYKGDISTIMWFIWMVGLFIAIAIPVAAPKYWLYSILVLGISVVLHCIILGVIKCKSLSVKQELDKTQNKIDNLIKNLKK